MIWSDGGIVVGLKRGRRPAPDGIEGFSSPTRTRSRTSWLARSRPRRCSPAGSGRTQLGLLLPAAGPARALQWRPALAPAGGRTSSPSRRGMGASRSSWRRIASASRMSSTCPHCARSWLASPDGTSPCTASRLQRASPFASSLLFDYVAAYMYDGDAPLAERRAGALTLDRELLRELLGQEELRELLDPDALADLELSLQSLADDRKATTVDGIHDLLRRLGDLSRRCVVARVDADPGIAPEWLAELGRRRAVRTPDRRRGSLDRDRGRRPVSRRGRRLGTGRRSRGIPGAGQRRARRVAGALGALARPLPDARARAKMGAPDRDHRGCPGPAARRGRSCAASSGRAAPSGSGAIRTSCDSSAGDRWPGCDAKSSRSSRRRSAGSCPTGMGSLPGVASVHALCGASNASRKWWISSPAWRSGVGAGTGRAPGADPRIPAAPARRTRVARGSHVGRAESLGRDDGRIVLVRPGRDLLRPVGLRPTGTERPRQAPRRHPRSSCGARRVVLSSPPGRSGGGLDRDVLDALWDLVWSGEVTNDTFAPLRALRWKRTPSGAARRPRAGRLTALGPPEAAGRWSLVEPPSGSRPGATHALGRYAPRTSRRPHP